MKIRSNLASLPLASSLSSQGTLQGGIRKMLKIAKATTSNDKWELLGSPIKAARTLSRKSQTALHHIIADPLTPPSQQRVLDSTTLSALGAVATTMTAEAVTPPEAKAKCELPKIYVTTPWGWRIPAGKMKPWQPMMASKGAIRRRKKWMHRGFLSPRWAR